MKSRTLLQSLTFLCLAVALLSPACAVDIPSVQALSGVTDYTYNALSQLTLEDSTRSGGFAYTFAYDDAGNPTTFKGVTHTFDGVMNQRTGESFVYDDNGNPTTYKGTSGFTYDPNNHLTTYPNELTMGYHQGLRAWKDDGTDRTYYLYSGVTPVCEMDEDGDVIATNTFGANGLVARTEGENTTFYTFDEGGNVAQTLESDGDVLSTELYDSYGNRIAITGTNDTPYGYGAQHGYYTDRETGLVLATYRYYDPTEGRWLTRDPIGYAGGLNLYGYCGGDPVNGIDPLGLMQMPAWFTSAWQYVENAPTTVLNWMASGTTVDAPGMNDIANTYSQAAALIGEDDPLGASIANSIGNGFREAGKATQAFVNTTINTVVWAGAGAVVRVIGEAGAVGGSAVGKGGIELQTHHIVEQRWLNRIRFGNKLINGADNLVVLEKPFHQQVSNFYSRKQPWLTGEGFSTVRQWMNTKSFAEQYEYGQNIMYYLMTGVWPK